VNIYPSTTLSVVGEFRPHVTGRARVVRKGAETSIEPPIPVEVEVAQELESDAALIAEIEDAIHSRLMFRSQVQLIPESEFGDASDKTNSSGVTPLPTWERHEGRGVGPVAYTP
jgi:hypothetical protein